MPGTINPANESPQASAIAPAIVVSITPKRPPPAPKMLSSHLGFPHEPPTATVTFAYSPTALRGDHRVEIVA